MIKTLYISKDFSEITGPELSIDFQDLTIPVTSIDMTRFSLSLLKSVEIVDWALTNSYGGEIFVPKIPSYNIKDLVSAINPKAKIKIIGLRPGEKTYEEMISGHDALNTYETKTFYIILPFNNKRIVTKFRNKFKAKKVKNNFTYRSDTNKKFLKIPELQKIIKNL